MAINKNITTAHIIQAIKEIDSSPERRNRMADRYFLRYNGIDYPPKLVISLANKYPNKDELDPSDFNTYLAQDYLREKKFTIIDIHEAYPKKYNGFKLISLDLRENSLLGTIYYDFIDDEDNQETIYTSVLIGPNGTGKSNLFRTVIELFKELNDLRNGGERSYKVNGQFSLKYGIDNNIFDYTNFRNFEKTENFNSNDKKYISYLLKNGKFISTAEAILPTAIVANSIMLTDKYPIYNSVEVFPIYKYLGIRNKTQNASTRSYVRKTIEFIVQEFDSSVFRQGLINASEFLGLGKAIEIVYYTLNTNFFFQKAGLTPEMLNNYFTSIKETYDNSPTTAPFKLNTYLKLSENKELIKEICRFCNQLSEGERLIKIPNRVVKKIKYNIISETSFQQLKSEFILLEHLRQLGILTAPDVQLNRSGDYSLQESSSGEYHFFSSMVGLMATIKSNSLIFIDEPEVSLHPNWQMQYLTFLRKLFPGKEFSSSHLMVATHSHFLISDLDGQNSKIIGLRRNREISVVNLPENVDTYGWSAEDVLFNIFNVTSTRNRYISAAISELLDDLSKGSLTSVNLLDKNKYEMLINLRDNLKSVDPLKEVVDSILKRISVS